MATARNRYANLLDDGTPQAPYGGITGGRVNTAIQPSAQTMPGTPTLASAQQLYAGQPISWDASGVGSQWQQGPQGNDYQGWFNSLFQNRPFNQQTLEGLQPLLEHYGFKLTSPNASGDRTKIQLPTGEWVRVGFGEGHPVWVPQTDAQGRSLFGGSGTAGAGGTLPGMGAGGGNYWSAMAGELGGPPPFEMPTMEQLQSSPGYGARLAAGQQALERGAAAKGSLLSGGFQKGLNRYAQDYASNEYGNLYNQYLARYGANVGSQSELPWRRYQDLLGLGSGATGILAGAGKVPLSTS